MEGVLWKWTNYWNGWQPRWFVLDGGILAYYKSQEEVNQGCKGSVKLSACEIAVHQGDQKRLDLVIPSEQHFYLRAASSQERQQWLVALGSAKAAQSSNQKSPGEKSPDSLKLKKSELRLYCDLLMQQVHTIKSSVPGGSQPDFQKINEAASLLSATCDTFIKTLEDCMVLANANVTFELPHQHVRDSALPSEPPSVAAPVVPTSLQIPRRGNKQSVTSKSLLGDSNGSHILVPSLVCDTHSELKDQSSDELDSVSGEITAVHRFNSSLSPPSPLIPVTQLVTPTVEKMSSTVFALLQNRFSTIEIKDELVPTESFLNACRGILPIFDLLGPTLFSPVKSDIEGNINKLTCKFHSDKARYVYIQNMVLHELDSNATTVRNSATDALLWLKRSLEFFNELIREVLTSPKKELDACVYSAYSRTLRMYHGMVVRGVFSMIVKIVPTKKAFILALTSKVGEASEEELENILLSDMKEFVETLDFILTLINKFYAENNLDNNNKI